MTWSKVKVICDEDTYRKSAATHFTRISTYQSLYIFCILVGQRDAKLRVVEVEGLKKEFHYALQQNIYKRKQM